MSVSESDLNRTVDTEANKSVLDTTTVSEQLDTSRLSTAADVDSEGAAASVKARREAFEKKTSSFSSSTSSAQQAAVKPAVASSGSVSPVKSVASAFEKKAQPEAASVAPPAPVVSSGSVKNLMANLEKSNVVSKLGQSYAKPSTTTAGSSSISAPATGPVKLPGLAASGDTAKPPVQEEEEEEEGLNHATIARPVIPHKRRRPTVDKGLFSSPSQPQRKLLELDEKNAGSSNIEVEEEEEEEDVPVDTDVSAAFFPNAEIAALKATLASAGGMFERLEAKKRALELLVRQKKQTIKMLKEKRGASSAEAVEKNPNEGEEEEAEKVVLVEDEDAFLAVKYEQEEQFDLARAHHQKAFDKAMESQTSVGGALTESNARAIAAFASFMVRHSMEELAVNDALVEQVTDAFDLLSSAEEASIVGIKESVEAERAAFLFEILQNTEEALEAFQRAREIYPEDAEMLCNYARFVNKVLAREAMEDGDAKQVVELKALAADLYREALDIVPNVPDVRANLAAILVQLSKMGGGDQAEGNKLLEEAKYNLEQAVETRNPIVLYNLACVECLLGNAAECEKHLKEAVAVNPGFREDMKQDPDLEAVHGASWFKSLTSGA